MKLASTNSRVLHPSVMAHYIGSEKLMILCLLQE